MDDIEKNKQLSREVFGQQALVTELPRGEKGGVRMFSMSWGKEAGTDIELSDSGEYYIANVNVTPTLRKKGLGTEIFRHLKAHAERLHAHIITADLINYESQRAAENVFGTDSIIHVRRDARGRPEDDPDHAGSSYDDVLLRYVPELPDSAEWSPPSMDTITQAMAVTAIRSHLDQASDG